MMKRWILPAVGLLAMAAAAMAQTVIPKVAAIGPNDLFQDIVNGAVGPNSQYVTATQLGVYASSLGGANADNALIGGDFYQNLWGRTTTSPTINTTAAYGPDNWFMWSGTSTNLVATQQTGAADIPQGFLASARVTRSSTGIIQSCIGQEVESSIAERLQGQTAEFDFHALAGAGFSDASSSLHAYILTGTTADEGSSKMAWNINAGGGGSSGWTGAAVLGGTAGYTVPISAVWGRYSIVAPIPVAAKEVGVALCWTPVGTSPSNDYFEFTGAQLVTNPALSSVAGAAGAVLSLNDTRAKSFVRRNTSTEVVAQQRYFQSITEPATGFPIGASGVLSSTTVCTMTLGLPVSMRAAPAVTFSGTMSTSTWRIQDSTTSTLASTFLVAGAGNIPSAISLSATLTTASTAGWSCQLQGGATPSTAILISSEL